ncbi:MAG TPA: FAD-binding oxidoreductase [Alphaproteobacteria bacterium]|nr:FAD-binding oxidoreductase [Alphaproteobacteria bacterium]
MTDLGAGPIADAPSLHARSWYAASAAQGPARPRLEDGIRAEIAIIGAGYTGLSTALALAEAGRSVVLVEAERIGWGASGRNGGHIASGYNPAIAELKAALGEETTRGLWTLAEEAKALVAERVEKHRIACDLKWGYLMPATKQRQLRVLAAELASMQALGYGKAKLVAKAEMHGYVQSDAYAGALYDAGGGHLHPLNYALGLARAAEQAGARICEHSRATRLIDGPRPTVVTEHGRIEADRIVIATNAYVGDLMPALRGRIMPVGTYMLATSPMGEGRARALLPGDIAVADVNFVLSYYRLSADHRLLFGGGLSYSGFDRPDLRRALRATMLNYLPQLADLKIDYCWGGHIALTMTRLPEIGRLSEQIYFAQGYSGHGVALSNLAGVLIAEAIMGRPERLELFGRLPQRPFPGGRFFRLPALLLGTAWYRLRDRL